MYLSIFFVFCPKTLDESAHGMTDCSMKETERNQGAINKQVYKQIEVMHIMEYQATLKNW